MLSMLLSSQRPDRFAPVSHNGSRYAGISWA